MNRRALLGFLVHGVPHAFPAHEGPEAPGIPTAHSGPALRDRIESDQVVVWPSARGEVRGSSIQPLLPSAPELPGINPELYRWLTLVDALRVGRVRERTLATRMLEQELALTGTGTAE